MVFTENLIFFVDVFFGESLFEFISPFLKFLNQFIKALVNVFGLLIIQSLDFLLNMFYKLAVVVIYAFGVEHELVEIVNVLLYNVCHVIKLR